MWSEEEEWKGRLHNHCTVFGAELYAIYVVLKIINQTNNTYNIIFSDSLSSVLALKSNRSKNQNYFVLKIKQMIMNIKSGLELVWIPSHIQIQGNERADQLAKEGTIQTEIQEVKEDYANVIKSVKGLVYQEWQKQWNHGRWRLCKIKPVLGEYPMVYRDNRKEEIVMARLRMGVCLFSHQRYITGNSQLECHKCDVVQTLEHLVITCLFLENKRQEMKKICKEANVEMTCSNILAIEFPANAVVNFLKEINFFMKI